MEKSTRIKILIIAPAWVGDLVMANALLRLLKFQYAQAQQSISISLLVSANLMTLAKYMPEVDEIIQSPFGHGMLQLSARYALAKK